MHDSTGSAKQPRVGLCVCLLLWVAADSVQAAPERGDGAADPLVAESRGTVVRLLQAKATSGFNPFDADHLRMLDAERSPRRNGDPLAGVGGARDGRDGPDGPEPERDAAGAASGNGSSRSGAPARPSSAP